MENQIDRAQTRGEFRIGHRLARVAWGITAGVSALCAVLLIFGPLSDQSTFRLADADGESRGLLVSAAVAAGVQP